MEEPIISQGALDELQYHHTPGGNSKVKISLYIRKSYQGIYLEEIRSISDQVRPVVYHLDFFLPERLLTEKKIVEALKGSQIK